MSSGSGSGHDRPISVVRPDPAHCRTSSVVY